MNATAAVSEKTKKIEDMAPVEELSAAENDLTCMRALFRMRRRAEVALARIEAATNAPRH